MLKSKTIEGLKDLIKQAQDAGADEDEGDDIIEGLQKLMEEQIALALEPFQEKMTANLAALKAPTVVEHAGERVKGLTAARALRAWVLAEGDRKEAIVFAKSKWGDDEPALACLAKKTLIEGGNSGGGFLVSGDPAGELIELLRPLSVIRSLGPQIVSMISDSKRIPRIAGGASSGYIGENEADQASDLNFEQLILRIKKLRATVAISNELNDDADGATDQMVIDDIVSSMAVTEDVNFIRGVGTENAPKGLLNWALAANVVASVAANDGTNPTLDEVREDLSAMLTLLSDANSRMIRPVWIMSNRTSIFLRWNLTDGNNNQVFGPEMATGKLDGIPFAKTNNIPDNLESGDRGESELYLVDMADVVIGDRKQVEFKISQDASFVDSAGNTVSAFDNDLLVIRAIARHDLVVRHAGSIAVRTGLVYTTS